MRAVTPLLLIGQSSLSWVVLPPRDVWPRLESPLVVTAVGMRVASSGWRLGVLLNVLQLSGQPPATEGCLVPNANRAEIKTLFYTNHSSSSRPGNGGTWAGPLFCP